jgi:plasmid stability protein
LIELSSASRFSAGTRIAIPAATEVSMAQLIVRKLDDAVKRKLERRAAANGRSLEKEICQILHDAVSVEAKPCRSWHRTDIMTCQLDVRLTRINQESSAQLEPHCRPVLNCLR